MKIIASILSLFCAVGVLSGCTMRELFCRGRLAQSSENNLSSTTGQQLPRHAVAMQDSGKEILFFDGDTSRAYTVLGSVEYEHDKSVHYGNTLDLSMEAQKLVKDGLKSVAFTKFGDQVDAIINVRMSKRMAGGVFGGMTSVYGAKTTIISGSGVAVSYKAALTKEAGAGSVPDEIKANDPLARLKTLMSLKEAGLLTEEEYQAKRKAVIEKL